MTKSNTYYIVDGKLKDIQLEQDKINKIVKVVAPEAMEAGSIHHREQVIEALKGANASILNKVAKLLGVSIKETVFTQDYIVKLVHNNEDNEEMLNTVNSILEDTYKEPKKVIQRKKPEQKARLGLEEVYAVCYKALEINQKAPETITEEEMVKLVFDAQRVANKEQVRRLAGVCDTKEKKFYGDRVNKKEQADAKGTLACYIPLEAPVSVVRKVKDIYSTLHGFVESKDLKNSFIEWCKKYIGDLDARKAFLEKQKEYAADAAAKKKAEKQAKKLKGQKK